MSADDDITKPATRVDLEEATSTGRSTMLDKPAKVDGTGPTMRSGNGALPSVSARPSGSDLAPTRPSSSDLLPRSRLAQTIPRRPRVAWWLGLVLAALFTVLVTPAITADRWLAAFGAGQIVAGETAPMTVRVPAIYGVDAGERRIAGGGVLIARGEVADAETAANAQLVVSQRTSGPLPYAVFAGLAFVLAAIFSHHMRRSTHGRLVRVQVVALIAIAGFAAGVKAAMLATPVSLLAMPIALFALVPTLVLDRVVGLATGVLAALVVALLAPFDVGVAIVLLVQAAAAGLVVAERPRLRWRAALVAGLITIGLTAATYGLVAYLTTGALPPLGDPLRSPWLAVVLGPALAMILAPIIVPPYQLLVGEVTQGRLIELEDLSNPLLRQIAEKSPGTWQHSLMMANLAEIAANAIGASGRLVRVGAYYHDLGKSLQPKYFIENLEPGETSPHDQLPPHVSCDAIFAHVTEGIVAARRAGLHERIIDFMHMHHGNGVLEYFWSKCREQGNPEGLAVDAFRYPGHPPQSRETAILAICDAVEAASRTLKKPDAAAIDSLVQRIVYGKLHLGQLDESGLSMSDLRRISDSLRETIRHANHGRIEYPWQKAQQDASASVPQTTTAPRLDSLDNAGSHRAGPVMSSRRAATDAIAETADLKRGENLGILETAPVAPLDSGRVATPAPEPDPADSAPIDLVKPRTKSRDVMTASDATSAPDQIAAGRATIRGTAPEPSRTSTGDRPRARSAESARTRADDIVTAVNPALPPAAARRAPEDDIVTAVAPALPAVDEETPTLDVPVPARPAAPGTQVGIPIGPPPATAAPEISHQTFADVLPSARKRSATLPPTARPRPPSMQTAPLAAPSSEPREGGPPASDDLDSMVTNPPPSRRSNRTIQPPGAARKPAAAGSAEGRHGGIEPDISGESPFDMDASVTDPRMPVMTEDHRRVTAQRGIALPLQAPPSNPAITLPAGDSTRKQSFEEIEELHRRSTGGDQHDSPTRRVAMPTAEVDPDDIEAAIEIAPPARRPASAIGVAKPKKPE